MFTWVEASAYNISAPALVYLVSTRAKLKSFIVQVNGTAGVLTFNDSATLAGANTSNQIASYPYNSSIIVTDQFPAPFDWPLDSGLVISSLPTGMVIAVSYEYLIQ